VYLHYSCICLFFFFFNPDCVSLKYALTNLSVSFVNNRILLCFESNANEVCSYIYLPKFSFCRLLPYHVVADYEAEEDDRILDSDTTGQMLSRSQQWDNNIAAKIAEFTATFEKQALAFNIISQKRSLGEFRSEERLMIEQALLQEEKRALIELRAELESREKAGREAHEAKLRMAAMYQAEQQARADSQSHAEMMSRAPIRGSALGSQGSDIGIVGHDMGDQDHGEMMNGWGNNAQRDEKEPSEDFLNDEAENGDTGTPDGWREVGEFDLNAR